MDEKKQAAMRQNPVSAGMPSREFSYRQTACLSCEFDHGAVVTWLTRLILLFLLACGHGELHSQPSSARANFQPHFLKDETLRYRLVSGKTVVGEVRLTIARATDGVIHIIDSTSGLFERTTVLRLRDDATLAPLSSHGVVSRDSRVQEVRLRYEAGRVTGEWLQPASLGGNHEIALALEPGTHDLEAVPQLLRASDLIVGRVIAFPIYNALQNQIERARGWVVKLEEVQAPAGKFNCYRVEGFSGRLRWILFIAADFPRHVIKQILPGSDLMLELVEVAATY
jgi:hypothetical protein